MIGGKTIHVKRLGDGSVRQVSSKWSWRIKVDGKSVDKSTGCETKAAAMALVSKWGRQDELVKSGLLSSDEVELSQKPVRTLKETLAAYTAHQKARRLSKTTIHNTNAFLTRIITGTGCNTTTEMGQRLAGWVDSHGDRSPRWLEVHVKAVRAFLAWAAIPGIPSPGLTAAKRVKVSKSQVRPRRAFTVSEVNALCKIAPSRALIYKLLFTTGFRVGELDQVLVGNVDLDRKTISLPAKQTKSKRDAVQPIPDWIIPELQQAIDGRMPTDQLCRIPEKLLARLNNDMRKAGISKLDHTGRTLDLHSLRKTFITELVATTDIKTAQTLARHTSAELTIGVYAESTSERASQAVNAIGNLDTQKDTLLDTKIDTKGVFGVSKRSTLPESKNSQSATKQGFEDYTRPDLNGGPFAPEANALSRLSYGCLYRYKLAKSWPVVNAYGLGVTFTSTHGTLPVLISAVGLYSTLGGFVPGITQYVEPAGTVAV